tara:strand:+ start:465 stop:752 length:288 start_codon:yes stop_codon:yes gene_type:complete
MEFIETKIKDLKFKENELIIECEKCKLLIKIIDGTVNINLKTTENEIVGYSYLEKNDIVKIIYKNKINNYIIPKKIIVNTKYTLNTESSDSETLI